MDSLQQNLQPNGDEVTQCIRVGGAASRRADPLSKSTILVVDDNIVIRKLARSLLEQDGLSVLESEDALAAMALLTSIPIENFECVITDYQMPGEDGIKLAQRIKELDANLSIVMLTAIDEKDVVKQSFRAGIFDFVEKDAVRELLNPVVQKAIKQTRIDRRDRSKRYLVELKLGSGGLGQVYQVWDEKLKRHAALKRLYPTIESEDSSDLFREAHLLAQLQHPNIVQVYDCGIDAGGAFIIMELVKGQTLEKTLEDTSKWTIEKLVQLAHECLDGLSAAHELGILHLDLKPSNIMITTLPSGSHHFKILDFGLSRFHQPISETQGEIMASPLYAAPEILSGEAGDRRSDLYSLGCTLYKAAAGEDAFLGAKVEDTIRRHCEHDVIPLSNWRPDLQPAFCDWVMGLIQKQSDDRPRDALASKLALQAITSA